MGRLLAIDYGHKRLGLALSDETHSIASPLPAELRGEKLFSQLQRLCITHAVDKIVIGLPVTMRGKEERAAESIRAFAEQLGKQLKLPIVLLDERLTTAQAEKLMIGHSVSRKRRKEHIDSLAAAILLQTYLDSQGKPPSTGDDAT